jgi:hypothetical protein
VNLRNLIGLGLCLLVLGCDSKSNDETTASTDVAGPSCGTGENLLENPQFDNPVGHTLLPWKTNQHAGEPSFSLSVEEGVATITRFGTQPWFDIVQLPPIENFRGKELLFRADVRLSLTDEGWPYKGMETGGGLQILVWGAPVPVLGSSRQVYTSSLQQEPRLGETDWFTMSERFSVPADASKFSVGIQQRAVGSMSIRNPQLMDCGPAAD